MRGGHRERAMKTGRLPGKSGGLAGVFCLSDIIKDVGIYDLHCSPAPEGHQDVLAPMSSIFT